jgi:uncharacterized membrane protein YdbT with pleckstrin-like domain
MGAYSKKHLLPDESILYETNYHWIHFLSLQGICSLFIVPWIQQLTDEFVITNRRVIIKKGLIKIWTFEMGLNKIETVFVNQSVMGRILNYGTITVVGNGGTREQFDCIQHPLRFRLEFMDAEFKMNHK